MTRLRNAAFTIVALIIAFAVFAFLASLGLAVIGALTLVVFAGALIAPLAAMKTSRRRTIDL